MDRTKYDIFISYRRRGGSEKAELLKAVFEKRGFKEERIFMDTHALKGGDFTVKLKNAITESANIIVLITKGCFEQIKKDDFWVYEISQALEQNKNIIPVYFDGITQIDGKDLPDVLQYLPNQNAVTYVHEYADACYDKICSFLVSETPNSLFDNGYRKTKGLLVNNKKGCLITITIALTIIFGFFLLNPLLEKKTQPQVIAQSDPTPVGSSSIPPRPEPTSTPEPTFTAAPKSEKATPAPAATHPIPVPKISNLTKEQIQIILASGRNNEIIPDTTIIIVNGHVMDYNLFRKEVVKGVYRGIKVISVNPNGSIVVTVTKDED